MRQSNKMRLLHAEYFTLSDFNDEHNVPEYAILSHTWGDDEVTFRDLAELSPEQLALKKAYKKIMECCKKTLQWGLKWVWIDTCCIDQTSSAELSEAINSMYQWYQQAAVCYAYLFDVTSVESDFLSEKAIDQGHLSFDRARWFTRGWCLQELLAPRNMQFYNVYWDYIGSKNSLKERISTITHIDEYGLFIPDLSVLSVAHRMSWAAGRETTRPEDIAYCLLGIFNINMPLIYGEGQARAFGRLQEEIMSRTEDHSIFAWNGNRTDFRNDMVGFLAPHPSAFNYGKVELCGLPKPVAPLSITGRGIRAQVPLINHSRQDDSYLAVIGCHRSSSSEEYYAIPVKRLKKSSDIYQRSSPELQMVPFKHAKKARLSTIFLLRHSKPTHLEHKDTRQVWLSLLEMKDCIYNIKTAYPESLWNVGRRVFAFSPLDKQAYPRIALAIANLEGRAFVLRIDLDPLRLHLVEFNEPLLDLIKENLHDYKSLLVLGQDTVTASVERSIVFGQELYEMKISIVARGNKTS